MPTRPKRATLAGNRVYLRPPRRVDQQSFLANARASRALHERWVKAPESPGAYAAYLARYRPANASPAHAGFLVLRSADNALAGVFNFSEIVRGVFRSAYVGYYGFAPLAGGGYMTEGFALALDIAFRQMRLHRVEANVQPANARSLALLKRVGFTREGYSRRYVKIAGRWRDHVRFAMLAEDWTRERRRVHRAIAQSR
jgi:ribosomal-protein-alanine N-acetyltransferase